MDKCEFSDKKLISKYLRNDNECFEILYQRYRRQLFSYLNKLLPGQNALVDDLFQQTWLKAINSFGRYQDKQTFLAWMVRIARNLSIDHFRKAQRRQADSLDGVDLPTIKFIPGSDLDHVELAEAISKAVQELPQDQREVFMLRQNDIPFKEIAEIQQTSLNTTLGRMHYAIQKLRLQLQGWL